MLHSVFNWLQDQGQEKAHRFLLQLSPEDAHNMLGRLLPYLSLFLKTIDLNDDTIRPLHTPLFQKKIACPVGLGAGFDKEGLLFSHLAPFGFGFFELGTFTTQAQKGNPLPRIKRFSSEQAIINKMGFNNPGLLRGIKNIKSKADKISSLQSIGISIGKSKTTEIQNTAQEYENMIHVINQLNEKHKLQEHISYIAINISSPNTPGLRSLQSQTYIKELLDITTNATSIPLIVKLSPDQSSDKGFLQLIKTITNANIHGIVVSNTSTQYSLLNSEKNIYTATQFGGGISGKPIQKLAEYYLQLAYQNIPSSTILLASGGVMTPHDVWHRIILGASFVQLYTGLIYHGISLLSNTLKYLTEKLNQLSMTSINEVYANREYLQKQKNIL